LFSCNYGETAGGGLQARRNSAVQTSAAHCTLLFTGARLGHTQLGNISAPAGV